MSGVRDGRPLYPQLRARRNASRDAVAAHQRTRLHAAMIEVVSERGYTAATAAELVALAGVSKKALYQHFESKEQCFLATYDLVVRQAMSRISAAYQAGPDRAEGLCRAFDAFNEELVEHPKPSQLALAEILAAGPAALARIERVEATFLRMITQSLSHAYEDAALPPVLIRGFIGGVWFVSRNRLLQGQPTIATSGRVLLDWLLAYRSPSAGSLTLVSLPSRTEVGNWPVRTDADERLRMMQAAAYCAARGGFGTLTSAQIIDIAGVSQEAFSAAFDDVSECFLSSLELLGAQALARALRESSGAPSWAAAVCRAVHALFCQVAENPIVARVAFVEVFAAGPVGIERRAALMRAFAAFLLRRAPAEGTPTPLIAEAIVGAVWSVAYHQVAHGQQRILPSLSPYASYLVLAPIIGADAAAGVIKEESVHYRPAFQKAR
jgi:AcrR family transcriptional regulator